MLTKCEYLTVSGTSVATDFVELPSQIMENWCFEKECLDLFAEHYETKEKIPEDLIQKISKREIFNDANYPYPEKMNRKEYEKTKKRLIEKRTE